MVTAHMDPNGDFFRRLSDAERRLANLERAQPLQSSSSANTNGTPGIIIKDGKIYSSDFDGNLDTGAQGTAGWGLGGITADAFFNTIGLRGGIIGDDALANPVTFDQVGGYVDTLQFTTTPTTFLTKTLTIPAGFTKILFISSMLAGGLNPTGGADNLQCQITASPGLGPGSSFNAMGVPTGLSTIVPNFYNQLGTGLTPGGTITINGLAWTTVGTWPTSINNFVTFNVVAIYLR